MHKTRPKRNTRKIISFVCFYCRLLFKTFYWKILFSNAVVKPLQIHTDAWHSNGVLFVLIEAINCLLLHLFLFIFEYVHAHARDFYWSNKEYHRTQTLWRQMTTENVYWHFKNQTELCMTVLSLSMVDYGIDATTHYRHTRFLMLNVESKILKALKRRLVKRYNKANILVSVRIICIFSVFVAKNHFHTKAKRRKSF